VADLASHARHDGFAIADAIGSALAPSMTRTCPACGALLADLLALQRAVREAWVPRRPQDMRLSVADALRLRRRSWRQRLALIGSAVDALTGPLARSFTVLGLAGLLLTVVPAGFSMGSAGAAPAASERAMMAADGGMPTASPAASTPATTGPSAAAPVIATPVEAGRQGASTRPTEGDPLTGLSITLLALGTGLFGLRRLAPRASTMR
jgi:hypothetical protein